MAFFVLFCKNATLKFTSDNSVILKGWYKMHIPDGYLSLQTSLPAVGVMLPVWSVALSKIKKTLNFRQIPLLSLCAAFSFVIMMFNIPIGPSSVHAVGAVFVAILLGPWAACISISVALIIQAVVFGDGGILAIGINSFNMAFAMPFAGYFIYRLVAGKSGIGSKRSMVGVFAGSYFGLNLAALLTAIEFGIQPLLFKTAEGLPEFGFYPLSVSIPVIMLEHLFVAGPLEGIVTMAAISYLVKFNPQLFEKAASLTTESAGISVFRQYKAFILGIAVLVILAPLGLISTGTAWGEWGTDEIQAMVGYVPSGLDRLSQIWQAVLPDYSVPGLKEGFLHSSMGYILSAVVGIVFICVIMFVSSRFVSKKDTKVD